MTLQTEFQKVEGVYQLTDDWMINLPCSFSQRPEDGCLVLWRSGISIWIAVWDNHTQETMDERYQWIRDETSPFAFDQMTEHEAGIIRYAYRLDEEWEDEPHASFYGYVIGRDGHVQIAIYFDLPDDITMIKDIWRSIQVNQ